MKTALTSILIALAAATVLAQDKTYGLSEPYYSQLLQAHQLYQSNEFDGAISIYTNLLNAPIPCGHKCVILERIGDWNKRHTNYAAAIAAYEAILDYPTRFAPIETNDVRGYNHDCHMSCIQIAQCYELQDDLTNAIHYATMSLTYPAVQFCGLDETPFDEASRYIERLKSKHSVPHGTPLEIAPMTQEERNYYRDNAAGKGLYSIPK